MVLLRGNSGGLLAGQWVQGQSWKSWVTVQALDYIMKSFLAEHGSVASTLISALV